MPKEWYGRVEWWLERSSSPEYQEAYDRIASSVPVSPGGVFLDVACGSGELLERMRGKARKLVGSDATKRMLEEAAQSLYRSGMPVEIFDRSLTRAEWEEEAGKDRVALYLDNILHTTLPEGFFDAGSFTFPDVRAYKSGSELKHALALLCRRLAGLRAPVRLDAVGNSFSRVKPHGVFALAIYGRPFSEYTALEASLMRIQLFGTDSEPLSHAYHSDSQIGIDHGYNSDGYRIFVVRRPA